ncbi:DUF1559 domain-containing protein [Pirellulaceae bacterium SH467]
MTPNFTKQPSCGGSTRIGTTLTEMVVSIAIISLLASLLVNAVQSARESARRLHCLNNLRNLSLSVLAFESSNGSIPIGINSPKNMSHDTRERHNFVGHLVHLLPHVEGQALYSFWEDSYRSPSPWWRKDLTAETQSVSEVFRCPSDNASSAVRVGDRDSGTIIWASGHDRTVSYLWLSGIPPRPTSSDVAMTNYLGNAGRWPIDGQDTTFPPDQQLILDKYRGPFRIARKIKLNEIVDGLSSTLLLGEVTGGYNSDGQRVTSFAIPSSPMWTHWNTTSTRGLADNFRRDWIRFSSSHSGNLINWAKADGACMTMSAELSPRVMLSLSGIADSESIKWD